MITIILVDDHKIVRQGVRSLLESESDFRVIGEAGSGVEAMRLIDKLHPDVLVTDLAMGGMSGIELCQKVHESWPTTQCIILSMYGDEPSVAESLRVGASGYVLKEGGAEDLISAIRTVVAGRIFLSPPLPESLEQYRKRHER